MNHEPRMCQCEICREVDLLSRAQRAEQRCVELSAEVGSQKRATFRAEGMLAEERIITRGLCRTIANRDARITELERLLGGHACGSAIQVNEEVLSQRDAARETLRQIIDIAKNGMGERR